VPFAVLASGRGSNFEAIVRALEAGELRGARIVALLSDQPAAPVIEKARARGIPTLVVPQPAAHPGQSVSSRRELHDEAILTALAPFAPRFLVLAGYMRLMSPKLIRAFRSERGYSRIVNVHPSLLPAFPGLEGYAQAFRHGAKITGATVHLVDDGLDTGPICAQEAFSIADLSDEASVERRGLEIEHQLYPKTLNWVLPENFVVDVREKGRVCVRPS
jgi:phosphoribosylglycinamide formyltransferase-1